MKRVLVACFGFAAMAGLVGSANAADLPRRYEQPAPRPAMVQIYNWTGPYIGIAGGGAWGRGSVSGVNISHNGGIIGGTVGYNWQASQVVFGVEGDLSWVGSQGRRTAGVCVSCDIENTWLGTVRGRLGYAADRFLPYLTGGLAFGNVRTDGGTTAPGASSTRTGWTLGGGVEVALSANWTAKAEYLYVDLGSFSCGTNCPGPVPNSVSLKNNIVRAGINYRF